jgi:hypothetical protein
MAPKLTIGMAHYNDFDGVYFTLQALRFYHDMRDVEFLVVDNSQETLAGKTVKQFLANISNAHYVAMQEAIGTSAPRDRVFREAAGEAVMCIDCHVLLAPGAVARLLQWYEANPESKDLLTGPMIYDSLGNWSTHFDLQWRSEMWGTWGQAWTCKCGQHFTIQEGPQGSVEVHDLMDVPISYQKCPTCGNAFPTAAYAGHERTFSEAGYKPLGLNPNDPPFEIPAQGLGLFTCRKDAWLGFNPSFRGFGGEEGYIHIKHRQAGRKCLNLPFLGWMHRFGRVGGPTYPLQRYDKVRNYVIGHQELGLPLDPIYEHFVTSKVFSEKDWAYLLENPVEHISAPCGTCGGPQPADNMTLDQVYEWTKSQPRDMETHMDRFRELASKCNHVTAMVKRKEWDVTLLAGRPNTLRVYTTEPNAVHEKLKTICNGTDYKSIPGDSLSVSEIEETDLLVIHTVHQADHLYAELERFAPKVRRWILLRSTGVYGEIGEPEGPGLFPAMRRYLRAHPEWSVIEHNADQYGYTLLSRDPADKPELPSMPKMAWNYAKALARHQLSGAKATRQETIDARLDACSLCPQRTGNRCSVCGCFLDEGPNERDGKVLWPESVCPLGKWYEEAAQ